ncbi:MAG: hypothetical protein LBG21_01245 [Campylobacteraceae bacterium]|jgi:hypothetical protein|nr:hypothetical protein [Campylobacteraceae bacterium]
MKKYLFLLLISISFSNAAYLYDYGADLLCIDEFYFENKDGYINYLESDTKKWTRRLDMDIPKIMDGFEYKDGKCIKTSNDIFMMSLVGIFCGFLTLSGMIYLVMRVHR